MTGRNEVTRTMTQKKNALITNRPDAVEVCRDGQFVWVYPRVRGLRDAFYTVRHQTRPDKERGYSLEPCIVDLVQPDPDEFGEKRWMCRAGLEPLVVQWLENHGYEVHRSGERPHKLRRPDLDALEGLDGSGEVLLETICKHDHTLFRYQPGQVDLHGLIEQIALAWPKENILLLATRVEDCRRLGKQLRQALSGSEVTVHTGRDFPQRAGRIVVATSTGWNEGRVKTKNWQILVALNPDELLRLTMGQIAIEQADRARVYGFLPVEQKLAPFDRDMVTAFFGPREVRVGRQGQSGQAASVVFTQWTGHLISDSELDAFEVKKQGVWHHVGRNTHVADLATALADGDEDVLRDQFPAVWEAVQGQMPDRTGVLVENVEHGLELAKLLPGWAVISGPDVWVEGLSPQDREILEAGGEDQQPDRVIVTSAGLPDAGELNLAIRADAGAGSSLIFNYVIDLWIDLNDDHHPLLRGRSKERRASYLRQGWTVDGSGKTTDLLSTFISTRPSRRKGKSK